MKHLVKSHTQAKHIRTKGVRPPAVDLGSDVSCGTAQSRPDIDLVGYVLPHVLAHATKARSKNPLDEVHPWVLLRGAARCGDHTEVDDLSVTVAGDQDVLGLDVPVDDPARM